MDNASLSEVLDYIDPNVYGFGEYTLDARHHKREVRYKGRPLKTPLTEQEYSVLTFLISKRPARVAAVDFPQWNKSHLVLGKHPAVICISKIRGKLGRESRQFIKHKRHSGYWFTGNLVACAVDDDLNESPRNFSIHDSLTTETSILKWRKYYALTPVFLILVGTGLFFTYRWKTAKKDAVSSNCKITTTVKSNVLARVYISGPLRPAVET